nr:MAG TPA_asm: hypothetical protein [Caudoviricetes sp.]
MALEPVENHSPFASLSSWAASSHSFRRMSACIQSASMKAS